MNDRLSDIAWAAARIVGAVLIFVAAVGFVGCGFVLVSDAVDAYARHHDQAARR